ncbi:MAG: site-specific DNA-methyltransferase [Lutibacter sp.]|jgi:DNA modification methylase
MTPFYQNSGVTIYNGDALEVLKQLPNESVQMCVTSPPYWGLRDYLVGGQIGLEKTPEEYVQKIVEVFHEVKRVLKKDGTCWINLGDSYAGSGGTGNQFNQVGKGLNIVRPVKPMGGLKPKDLVGIPWMVAFALRADGWYLRSDIIWHKPNPMPESVTDRPTKSHEYIFLLSKNQKYYYDADAIKEEAKYSTKDRKSQPNIENQKYYPTKEHNGIRQRKPAGWDTRQGAHRAFHREGRAPDVEYTTTHSLLRNKRSVWTVATHPCKAAHFATFPEKLIEPCILAGSRIGDTVIDPFGGSGTSARVAKRLNRQAILIELNPNYIEIKQEVLDQKSLF